VDRDVRVIGDEVPDDADDQTSSGSTDRSTASGNVAEKQQMTSNEDKLSDRVTAFISLARQLALVDHSVCPINPLITMIDIPRRGNTASV